MQIFELALYTAQIVVFQFVSSPVLSQISWAETMNRNKEWVEQNPEFKATHTPTAPWVSRVLGVGLLVLLFVGFFTSQSAWMDLAHFLSIAVFLIQALIFDHFKCRAIKKQIPARRVRSAALVQRRMVDIIPAPLLYTVLTLAVAVLVAWAFIVAQGFEEEAYYYVLGGDLLTHTVGFGALIYSVRRKSIAPDPSTSFDYRKIELWVVFLCQVAFTSMAWFNVVSVMFAPHLLKAGNHVVTYIFTVIPMVSLVWFMRSDVCKKLIASVR